jgi:tetratricopeptide (TPR) repeat protein
MELVRHTCSLLALCAALVALNATALESGLKAPAAGITPSAGVSSSKATAPLAAVAPGAGPAPAAAAAPVAPEAPAAPVPEAGLEPSDNGATGMSSSAVAGIPLEDGGELVLGPEDKVNSDDHKAEAARFQHMRKDGKLSATSDLDREVPRILKREQAGDIRGALLAARNALQRLPDHQNLRQITARLQIANGDYASALLTLAPLLEIDRDNWLPFYWAGVAELMQLNLDNARAYLARANQLDADRAEPWIARAVVEQEAGNFAGSLQLFAVARQRSPARPEILSGIAYSQAMLDQTGGVMQRPNLGGGPEAIVSQPLPSAAATPATTALTATRPKMAPQSFRNSPALASGMGFAARAFMP